MGFSERLNTILIELNWAAGNVEKKKKRCNQNAKVSNILF